MIEGPELLMRKVCANTCWIAGRDHTEPDRGIECQGPSRGGPCAVIEGPEVLVRKICANMCWLAGRDHTAPDRDIECQANVFWKACRGRCTCDLVDRFDGNASRVERLRLEHGKGRCGSGETYEG